MSLPQVSRITTQQPPDTTHASNTPTEMADGQSPSGVGPWLGGRMRGDSLSSAGSGPKTPVLSQTQEMGRIEEVLVGTPLARPTSNRSSGLLVTSPSTPVSPGTTGYFGTHGTPTMQQGPEQRGSRAMEQIQHSVQRLQNGYLEETRILDAEVQRPEVVPPRKKWWWQKPRWKGVQNRLVTVMIACMMCAILLAIYLGLALSKQLNLKQEWHVLLILIILVAVMFFCHSLVRLCLDLTGGGDSERGPGATDFSRIPSIAGPGGYAMPREPIRVNTQAPDIVPGMKEPPPVYGLWRCSVRVNPDEFYWVRRQSSDQALTPTSPHTDSRRSMAMSPRPPSYLSDDGVSYTINAVPEIRTMGPPLPIHPSERGRIL